MKKTLKILALVLAASLMLVSCGSSAKTQDSYGGGYYLEEPVGASNGFYSEAAYDMDYPSGYDEINESPSSGSDPQQGLILTFSASIDIETLDFDTSMTALREAIQKAGGYISSEHKSGGYTSYYGSYVRESVELEIKVPAKNFQSFVDGTGSCGNVKSINTWQQDITSAYMDTQARLQSLNAQKDRLVAMMEKAETVADLIQIEDQLSYTIYQIESYTSQMKVFQGLADYSTITIYLDEVSVVTSNPVTFGERIVETFRRTGRNIVSFCEEFVLTLIELLPVIAVGIVLFFLIRSAVKKHKAKKRKEYESWVKTQQAAQLAQQAVQVTVPAEEHPQA